MKPIVQTSVMAIVAAATSLVAAYFYPWPETVVQSEIVGQPLFEPYQSLKVKTVRLQRYNPETSQLEQLEIRRRGEQWVMPAYQNFTAIFAPQIGLTVNSLIEKTVLEERTDQQQDHLKYGVIDPTLYESMPNRSALGTKIILEDANREVLGNLIVGSPVGEGRPNERGERKHFVCIPGQPNVYVVEFNPQALATDFRAWADPNLFALSAQPEEAIRVLEVSNSRQTPETLGQAEPKFQYRAGLNVNRQLQLNLLKLEVPNEQGELVEQPGSPELQAQLQVVLGPLVNGIFISDVRKKSSEVSQAMAEPTEDVADSVLSPLETYGFRRVGFENGNHRLDSLGGHVSVTKENGVQINLHIGALVTDAARQQVELSHYVVLTAGVDESVFPVPQKPEASDDPEQADQDNKEYLRQVRQRDEKLDAARRIAGDLNRLHADWVYVIADSIITQLRPDLDMSAVAAAEPEAPAED